ncbi:MAG: ribonuclease R [Phycisphaerae bacterium]|nr:ribonuclease R [Phycisphaerae bacterium]
MPDRYVDAIIKSLAARDYQPLKPRQLARHLGVAEEDYGTFRQAIKRLRDSGRVVLGAKDALTLPEIGERLTGIFRANPRGFGFIVPDTPNSHGDLFVPEESTGGAMTGDLVVATVRPRGRRDGRALYAGTVVQILQRGQNRFVGTLRRAEGTWFVLPDGTAMTTPILVRDVGAAGPAEGTKVLAEIVQYGRPGQLPTGVIVETLGQRGRLEVETLAVIRAHGLVDAFSPAAVADARAAVKAFDPADTAGREDLTGLTVITIDPPDARDFDDAISLQAGPGGRVTLGVHIADVSHFVREGTALDDEARRRGTSTYFPRQVVPMLPEILSNGVCSLQEGQKRYCKSAFVTYDADAQVHSTRFAQTVIASAKRLTYQQAQGICDGKTGGYDRKVVELLRRSLELARSIEARRRRAGMLHLDLPEVELVFDAQHRVIDAVPEDQSYTHTLIEMFMVEANEAVARLFDRLRRPILRRIHPAPDPTSAAGLSAFVRAAGHRIPHGLTRADLQALLEAVKGQPASYAVNLAVLRTFQQAEYSPLQIGHFALASDHYCHFTSPIRRYPDLTVHRVLGDYCRGRLDGRPPEDTAELVKLGEAMTASERRSEAAEWELREVLLLQMLAGRVGEEFDGVVTGVANFGIFVQLRRFLIDGLIRLEDLGDDWWDVDARLGQVRGERTGRAHRIGDVMPVRVAGVDEARRQLNLVPAARPAQPAKSKQPPEAAKPAKKKHPQTRRRRRGARDRR